MSKSLTISSGVAAVILDLVTSLDGPSSTESVLQDIRRARLIKPAVEEAFTGADLNPRSIIRPELPKIQRS